MLTIVNIEKLYKQDVGSGIPIRRMLNKPDLKLGTVYVTDLIKDMLESLK